MNSRVFVCCLALLNILLFPFPSIVYGQQTAAPVSGVVDGKDGCVIPFQYNAIMEPMILVQVSINGKAPLSFGLDTGLSAPLVVYPEAVKMLGLRPGKTVSAVDALGQKSSLSIAQVETVRLVGVGGEGITFSSQPAVMADAAAFRQAHILMPHLAGLIGLGLLGPNLNGVRFDFEAKTMTVFTQTDLSQIKGSATVLAMTQSDALPLLSVSIGYAPGKSVNLMVDTGSQTTQLPSSVVTFVKPVAAAQSFAVSMGTICLTTDILFETLGVGSYSVPGAVVSIAPEPTTCLLGLNVLSRFLVTLDFHNMQMVVQQYPHPMSHEPLIGLGGYVPEKQGSVYVVRQVGEGSPAKLAGISIGDKILSVNGQSVSGLSEQQFGLLGIGPPGTRTKLGLERPNGNRLNVSFRLTSEFDHSQTATTGLILERPINAPITILAVSKGCPGDKANLMAGDQIVTINGKNAVVMSFPQLAAALYGGTLKATILHPGDQATRTVYLAVTTH